MTASIDSLVRERDEALARVARVRELLSSPALDPVALRHASSTTPGVAYQPRPESAGSCIATSLLLDAVADRRDLLAIRAAAIAELSAPTIAERKAALRAAVESELGRRWWDAPASEDRSAQQTRYARIELWSAAFASIDGDSVAEAYHRKRAASLDSTATLPGSERCGQRTV